MRNHTRTRESVKSKSVLPRIFFILRALYSGHIKKERVKQLTSILVGAKYLRRVGDYGHFTRELARPALLFARTGAKEEKNTVKLAVTEIIGSHSTIFSEILEAASHVG